MGVRTVFAAFVGVSCLCLTGCLGTHTEDGVVSRAAPEDQTPRNVRVSRTQAKINESSPVIQALAARRSVLPEGGAYDTVTRAVLAANARTAESALRAARLRADAAAKNWLPRLGPEISLTSLSSVAASLVLDATLFDNGRLKAERAFAKADVEVAAVSLAEDSNARAYTALELYLAAQEGREKAALDASTLKRMAHFQYIMSERVRGGVSDQSDLNVIRQKLAEIRASEARNKESAEAALAELDAMTAHSVRGVRGTHTLPLEPDVARPLAVLRAEAERSRAIAEARAARADQLPSLVATARLGDNSGEALRTAGSFGLGTGARLKAIEATKEAADRQVAQSTEDATRVLRRLDVAIAAKRRQAAEASTLTRAAKANLNLFQEQFDAGQRQVLDVVQVYETFARQQEADITLKYEAALAELELARVLGVLADGEAI